MTHSVLSVRRALAVYLAMDPQSQVSAILEAKTVPAWKRMNALVGLFHQQSPDKLPPPQELGLSYETWLYVYWKVGKMAYWEDESQLPDQAQWVDFPERAKGATELMDSLTLYALSRLPRVILMDHWPTDTRPRLRALLGRNFENHSGKRR